MRVIDAPLCMAVLSFSRSLHLNMSKKEANGELEAKKVWWQIIITPRCIKFKKVFMRR